MKHKHKGYESGGYLKLHDVSITHKDPKVRKWHDLEIQGVSSDPKLAEALTKNSVDVTNDADESMAIAKFKGKLEIDITENPFIKELVIKFKDVNGRKATVEFKNRA